MNKKNYYLLGGIIVLVILIIILVSMKQTAKQPAQDLSAVNTGNNTPGTILEKDKTPGPLTAEDIARVPLSKEDFIKYTDKGLETKTVRGTAGQRVFLTFSATDSKSHIFTINDPALAEPILVMFDKAGGDRSLNFLAPAAGTYEFTVDNTEKGQLIIE